MLQTLPQTQWYTLTTKKHHCIVGQEDVIVGGNHLHILLHHQLSPPPEQGSVNITMYSMLSHKIIPCPPYEH